MFTAKTLYVSTLFFFLHACLLLDQSHINYQPNPHRTISSTALFSAIPRAETKPSYSFQAQRCLNARFLIDFALLLSTNFAPCMMQQIRNIGPHRALQFTFSHIRAYKFIKIDPSPSTGTDPVSQPYFPGVVAPQI